MKYNHLFAMLVAMPLLGAALIVGQMYAEALENRYVHALAPIHATLTYEGSALTQAALQQPDLLPVFGGSEALSQRSQYQASTFFSKYPTGFETFEVAQAGAASLLTAEVIAALGPAVRDKHIVITFTPADFAVKQANSQYYADLFSSLHAYELAFNTRLSFDTRQAAAKRMLQYPDTVQKDRLLRFALQHLASGSALDHLMYGLSWPLGRLQTWILELQDHFQTASFILSHPELDPDITRQSTTIDWSQLVIQARREQMPHSNNNPYGFDNQVWLRQFAPRFKFRSYGSGDQSYLAKLKNSAEWTDLDILLRTLTELGAHPLLLGRPISRAYYEAIGVSSTAQQAFYDRMHQIAARYHVPVVDFADFGSDKFFVTDSASHTSREGWVYVDQVLDEFFHGTLP